MTVRTYEEILQSMLDNVSDNLDKREGSVIYDADAPAAAELAKMSIELAWMLEQAFADTANREYLIRRAAERNITPRPATAATIQGTFTPATVSIPTGARFSCDDLNYVVTEQISTGNYQLQCETAGLAGNKYSGMLIPIDYIAGLQNGEIAGILIPGEDEESTESLRERYFDSFRSLAFGGNRQDYTEKVTAIGGVGAVKVLRAWNQSIDPESMVPTSAVTTWYNGLTVTGAVREWIDAVYESASEQLLTVGGVVRLIILASDYSKASPTLVAYVQNEIDPDPQGEGYGLAPIGHIVLVETAEEVTVNVAATFEFASGYSFIGIKSRIEAVISNYLYELRRDWVDEIPVVRLTQLTARLLTVEGILDVTNLKINGSAANLTLTEEQIPVFGEVTENG